MPPGTRRLFVLVTALFFIWGIPNNLNDILIRQFMKSFVLTRFEAGLVQSAFYLGYFLLALPAGLLIKKRGYKVGFLSGLSFFALGCLLFWPAALLSSYIFFLGALFVERTCHVPLLSVPEPGANRACGAPEPGGAGEPSCASSYIRTMARICEG